MTSRRVDSGEAAWRLLFVKELFISFTYNPYDFIYRLRGIIPDTNASNPVFQDEELIGFAITNSNIWQSSMYYSYQAGRLMLPDPPPNVYRCAATAVLALAGNASRLSAVTGLLDVKLNGQIGDQMRKQAQAWLDMDDNSGAFATLEQCGTEWAFRDRWVNQLQRQTGGSGW